MGIAFLYPEGKLKALTMSYDDGVHQDRRLIEIFNRNGLKGTFHLNYATFGRGNRLNADEVHDLYQGHEVACHTATHPFLERQPRTEVIREIFEDRRGLESLCGYPVVGMSYPFGTWNEEVAAIARAAGIVYSRDTRTTGGFGWPQEFMHWEGTCHHHQMLERGRAFLEFNRHPLPLMYVWGHAYEFDNDDNWNELEEFAGMMGNRPDIWYATNIQVYRYIQAIRAAVTSVDGKTLYNPSAETLWVKKGDTILPVAPGETRAIAE